MTTSTRASYAWCRGDFLPYDGDYLLVIIGVPHMTYLGQEWLSVEVVEGI